jgi:hypothetical protein
MSDSESEEDYSEIERQFNDANFSISMSLRKIDKTIINNNIVAVKCNFKCYCYSGFPRNSEFFICRSTTNKITNRDLINCLIGNNFDTGCDHQFLEGFDINTEGQVSPYFGS